MMMFNYFFIMLYKGILKSSIPDFPRFFASAIYGLLITINIVVFFAFLSKIDLILFPFNPKQLILVLQFIETSIIYFYFSKYRINRILTEIFMEKFLKKRGVYNYAFIIYLILSIISIFIVAFFKPGYLPQI